MNKKLILMALYKGMINVIDEKMKKMMTMTESYQIYKTMETPLNPSDYSAGYVSFVIYVDLHARYTFPFVVIGKDSGEITARINDIISNIKQTSIILGGSSIIPLTSNEVEGGFATAIGVLTNSSMSADAVLCGMTESVKAAAGIVLDSIVKAQIFINHYGITNILTLCATPARGEDYTVSANQFIFDSGIIVHAKALLPMVNQQTNQLEGITMDIDVLVDHSIQRSTKNDYLFL
ncbi:MAG: hypothetical protein ACRC92_20515 [Peptostreptococcaceae bacterium]